MRPPNIYDSSSEIGSPARFAAPPSTVTEVDRLLKDRVLADRSRVTALEAKVSASQAARIRAETQITAAQEALQGISRRRLAYEGELQTARDKWRAAVATMLSSCAAIGIAGPTDAGDTVTPKPLRALAHFVTHWTPSSAKPGRPQTRLGCRG